MSLETDGSAAVRRGEELDVARLSAYLKERLPQFDGELTIEQFPHGHSNLTYLVRIGPQELVLRRPPFGNQVKTAHDMGREFRVLSKLADVYPPAPRPYLYCDDESVLGCPFYVMERRRGVILRKSLPRGVSLESSTMRSLSTAMIENLARLHAVDYSAAGLIDLGKPDGYVERQIRGWKTRYENAQTDQVEPIERVVAWLDEHRPNESAASVIHNDYKFDNLLLDPSELTRIVAVLDWEMATVGDPLMDLGTTLGYWVEANDPKPLQMAAMGPTMAPGSLTRSELVQAYEKSSGRRVGNPVFYYCFGLFKIAVIVQQIYARYVRGHTQDARFARLNEMVLVLSRQAEQVIDSGSI